VPAKQTFNLSSQMPKGPWDIEVFAYSQNNPTSPTPQS
jgi:hypothetical protein